MKWIELFKKYSGKYTGCPRIMTQFGSLITYFLIDILSLVFVYWSLTYAVLLRITLKKIQLIFEVGILKYFKVVNL